MFIENVLISDLSEHPLNLILNENYLAKPEFEDLFDKTIDAKEKKYQSYTQSGSLHELWLLIVMSGVSSASGYLPDGEAVNKRLHSQFDRIMLFDNFSHEIMNIYQKP